MRRKSDHQPQRTRAKTAEGEGGTDNDRRHPIASVSGGNVVNVDEIILETTLINGWESKAKKLKSSGT